MYDRLPEAAAPGALEQKSRAVGSNQFIPQRLSKQRPLHRVDFLVFLSGRGLLFGSTSRRLRRSLSRRTRVPAGGGLGVRTRIVAASSLELVVLPEPLVTRAIRRDERAVAVKLTVLLIAVVFRPVVPGNRDVAVLQNPLAELTR